METITQFFQQVDPNIVYMLVVAGVWLGVTAIYIAGTGVAETGAALLLGIAAFALFAQPTNWLAATVLILGVTTFLVLPLVSSRFARLAEAGLVLQAIGGYFLFNPPQVAIELLVVTIGLSWLYNRFIIVPIVHRQREFSTHDADENLIGLEARVVKPLDPVGTVYVNGELWSARSTDLLDVDTLVVVTEQRGLELRVEKAKRHTKEAINQPNGAERHIEPS